jgi:hypothetical protein
MPKEEKGMVRRCVVAVLVLGFAAFAHGAVVYQDIGTGSPPFIVGYYQMLPFDQAAQAAVPNTTLVTEIPGSPVPGTLTSSIALEKRTIGSGWATWSHGYAGPVFVTPLSSGAQTVVLTLPAGAHAFYFYVEPNSFGVFSITATTNSGATSGPIGVDGSAGARGFGFYATAGETISTITIAGEEGAQGFALAEFAVGVEQISPVPALSGWGVIFGILGIAAAALIVVRRLF